MTQCAHEAGKQHERPQQRRVDQGPGQWQCQCGQHGANPDAVEMRGGGAVELAQVPCEQLEHAVGRHAAEREQRRPAKAIATGPDDDQRADESAEDEQPMYRCDPLFQQGDRQHGHRHGRDHHDGGEFAHRQQPQAEKSHHRAGYQQQPAQQLQGRMPAQQQLAAMQRQQ